MTYIQKVKSLKNNFSFDKMEIFELLRGKTLRFDYPAEEVIAGYSEKYFVEGNSLFNSVCGHGTGCFWTDWEEIYL